MSGTVNQAPFQQRFLSYEIKVPAGVKKLDYRGNQTTSDLEGQTITLQGYRSECTIPNYGQTQGVEAQVSIYNLPDRLMRSLAGFGGTMGVFNYASVSASDIASANNVVSLRIFTSEQTTKSITPSAISRGAQGSGQMMTCVFMGSLMNCSVNMDTAPDPITFINCSTLGSFNLCPAKAISFKGAVDAAMIARQIATQMGYAFVNDGVTTILQNPYFYGNLTQQLFDLANQALFQVSVNLGRVTIWPMGRALSSAGASGFTTVNPATGLIGYPQLNGVGVVLRTIYNPSIRYGDKISVESIAPNVTGTYVVNAIVHHLSEDVPGGPWETEIQASRYGYPPGLTGL